jgi:scavenger receptor class B, member 1
LTKENLSEDDVVIVPNIPLISGIPNAKALGFFGEIGYKTIIASTKPREFQNISIRKHFFGYNDEFTGLISKIKWDFNPEDVGILAPRRGVSKHQLSVFSGTQNVNDVGKVYSVNNRTVLDVWKTEECNKVAGSDGVIYGPTLVQNKEDLHAYLPQFCRSLPLVFDKEEKILNGMRSYRYKAPFGTFSSTESYPENKFYCEPQDSKHQHIDGVLDVMKCIEGNPPILISHPHFMEGDAKLFEHFEGLNPDENFHESFAYLHPRLSVPIYGVSRMQINLRANHFGKLFSNLPDGIILPLAWIEITNDELPENLKTRLFLSTVIVDYAEILIKYGSLLSLMISSFVLITQNYCNLKYSAIKTRQVIKTYF